MAAETACRAAMRADIVRRVAMTADTACTVAMMYSLCVVLCSFPAAIILKILICRFQLFDAVCNL